MHSPRPRFRWLALALAFASSLSASVAAADYRVPDEPSHPSHADLEETRALFIAGASAVQSGRWADAVASFERAYSLSGAPSALYNVGVAFRALGRNVDARDTFDALLARHSAALDPQMRQRATSYRQEVNARIALLLLAGLDPQLHYAIRLDGRDVGDTGHRPIRVETDPGTHRIVAEHPDYKPFEWTGTLADGAHESIHVHMVRLPPHIETRSIFASPVFWIIAGAIVLGGAAVGGYLLYQNAQLKPLSDHPVNL